MTRAAAHCRELQRAAAVPTRPLSALLAVAGTDPAVIDSTVVDALRNLPVAPTRVTDGMRRRLSTDLDLFGTACAVTAVRSGAGRDAVAELLRAVSGLGVGCGSTVAAATVRYRRLIGTPATGDRRRRRPGPDDRGHGGGSNRRHRRPRVRHAIRSPPAGDSLAARYARGRCRHCIRPAHWTSRAASAYACGCGPAGYRGGDGHRSGGRPPLAGAGAVAAALRGRPRRLRHRRTIRSGSGQLPDAVVFVPPAAAPMSACDASPAPAVAAARTAAVVATVTKIDVHPWRAVVLG